MFGPLKYRFTSSLVAGWLSHFTSNEALYFQEAIAYA